MSQQDDDHLAAVVVPVIGWPARHAASIKGTGEMNLRHMHLSHVVQLVMAAFKACSVGWPVLQSCSIEARLQAL